MALSLPEEGIAGYFPDERSRIERLSEVRWPQGSTCGRCRGTSITWIETRSLFQCRSCRHQFSVTSDTSLHRTRLPLGMWFQAVESLICYRVNILSDFHMPAQALAETLGVQYVAARRIRKVVLADIEIGGQEFLRSAVCVRTPTIPPGVTEFSLDHLFWLLGFKYAGPQLRS